MQNLWAYAAVYFHRRWNSPSLRKRVRGYWLLVVSACCTYWAVATPATPANALALVGAPNKTAKVFRVYPYRKVRLCLMPDTQNLTNEGGEDGEIILRNADTTCGQHPENLPPSQTCVGEKCNTSRYCDTSWAKTGQIEVNNMAYELTGQYSKIDWSTIRGGDDGDTSALSNWTNQKSGISGCDVIISLGDIADEGDIPDEPYASKTPKYQRNWDRSLIYWKIIHNSGIPYIPNRGNHDARQVYAEWFIPNLDFASKPFFYAKEPTRGTATAIKLPMTNTGKPLCILSNNLQSVDALAVPVNSAEMAWIRDNSGCGAGYPTIIIAHDLVLSATTHIVITPSVPSYDTILAAHPEIFAMFGGHYISSSVAGISGGGVIHVFSNFQEEPRHAAVPDGWTGRDSGGTVWRAVIIDPRFSQVVTYDWSPYWETLGAFPSYYVPPSHPTLVMSKQLISFNYDARFP